MKGTLPDTYSGSLQNTASSSPPALHLACGNSVPPPPLACLPEHTNSYKHNTHTYVPKQVIFGKSKSANKEGTARNSKVSLATYDAVEGLHDPGAKRKKGKGAAGMAKKFAKRRVK